MNRLFRRADGVVWDLMTGKVGIVTKEGIATLTGEGDDAQIEINMIDQFGVEIPAFAQSTPVDAVKAGDIIYFGATDRPGWVIEQKPDAGKGISFSLMRADGTRTTWKPPKVSMLGFESGVMVLRSLLSMLPGGNAGLAGMQGALLPLMMMGGAGEGSELDLEKMLPILLMGQMQAAPVTNPDGTVAAAPNPMAQMLPMLMMMQLMKGDGGPFTKGGRKSGPFQG